MPPGCESYFMLAKLNPPVLEELQRETVIVSHGGVARAILALVGAVPQQKASLVEIWQGKILTVTGNRADWV